MAALRALRGRLLHCSERARVQSTDVLSPMPLKRFHELLGCETRATDFCGRAPLRSCFQWLFHPDCDVLNFPRRGHASASATIGIGADGNPEYVSGYRRMWVSGRPLLSMLSLRTKKGHGRRQIPRMTMNERSC